MSEMTGRDLFDESKKEIFLVTSCYKGYKSGMIVTWVTSASLIPERKRIVLILSPTNYTTRMVLQNRQFIIHLLSREQVDLVPRFGLSSSEDSDKFSSVPFQLDEGGLPIIQGTYGWARGKVVSHLDGGDRLIVLAHLDMEEVHPNKEPLFVRDLTQYLSADTVEKMQEKYLRDVERDRRLRWY
jgi:flavin reductase (DIM6/NTAB) family NADH-FMN oxidoreductase RutF